MTYTTEQLILMHEQELERLKRYFDKPKKETIERIEKEIKQLKEKK